MKPIVLKGHERSITFLKYNSDGDLLFTCSKANFPCVWYADTGERLGTYRGHTGAVWSVDVDDASRRLISGSADNSAKLWDVETGKELYTFRERTPVRSVDFSHGDRSFVLATDAVMNLPASIRIYNLADDPANQTSAVAQEIIPESESSTMKIYQVVWGPFNDHIFAVTDNGLLYVYDSETGKQLERRALHQGAINNISFSKDEVLFVTASSDKCARLWDTKSFEQIAQYTTDKPVNAASISPLDNVPTVLVGGGQEAGMVTTTNVRTGHFQVRIFHQIYGEELGTVKGHFGPINTLSFSPDGLSFASGAEDGCVRIHHFDQSYFDWFADKEPQKKGSSASVKPQENTATAKA